MLAVPLTHCCQFNRVTSPVTPPTPPARDQARAFVQTCIDRILGGDEALRKKPEFRMLTLDFAGGSLEKIEVVSFVPIYSAEGELLENQFKVRLRAEGSDCLGRRVEDRITCKVERENEEWSIDWLLEND